MSQKKLLSIIIAFRLPIVVLFGLILYITLVLSKQTQISLVVALITIALGSYELFKEVYEDLKAKNLAIDYIAILAIIVALVTKEYLVGAVIALMLSTGRTLEEYGANSAKKTLTSLAERIPHDVMLEVDGQTQTVPVNRVKQGQTIVVRKGEVIPLDGILASPNGVLDESSLTGEAYPVDKIGGDLIRSGTINLSTPIRVKVTNDKDSSSYTKIVNLVQKAQKEKAPFVRLADKYSVWFTIVTFIIAGFTYFRIGTLESILAVLVVATPCPLILATPIALIGGMNKSAKKRAIIKRLSSIEVLSRVNTIVFDKTGTITLGKPKVSAFEIKDSKLSENELLSIAGSIERNSLHPLAKAVVAYSEEKKAKILRVEEVHEIIGKGIEGKIDGKHYSLTKISDSTSPDMIIGLFEGDDHLASFTLEDQIKPETKKIVQSLKDKGFGMYIFTGDKKEVAKKLIEKLGINIDFKAEMKPEDKSESIKELQKSKIGNWKLEIGNSTTRNVVAMVGDGINDAPALALSDVGMVFSNEEQTAASEAADIVFLGGNFSSVIDSVQDSKNTIKIAKQSIFWGIGLSIFAMVLASFGYIPPIAGAIIQEGIDVAVIINALRASR